MGLQAHLVIIKMKKIILLLSFITIGICGFAQSEPELDTIPTSPSDQAKMYAIRIKKSRINGIYIPKDINEAMKDIDERIDSAGREKFKQVSEKESAKKFHFTFGQWMSHNWSLPQGSRLSHYLKGKGLTFVDDMMVTLSVCYHRHINGIPLDEDKLIAEILKRRHDAYKLRFKNGTTISKRKLPRPGEIDTLHRE